MRASSPTVRAPVVGVALSASQMVTTWTAPNGTLDTREVPIDTTGGDVWVSLRDGLRAAIDGWRTAWRDGACTVRIALLPPLVEVRTVSLPPVSTQDAQRLLVRAAARHFLSATEPVAVGVSTPVGVEGDGVTRVAAATSMRLLRALREAVTTAGGTLGDVVPALAAWSLGEAAQRGPHGVIEVGEHLVELVTWQYAAPIAVRRFARADDLSALREACASLDGPVALVATDAEGSLITSALAQRGLSITPAHPDAPAQATSSAAARAAWRLATVPWIPNAEGLPLTLSDRAHDASSRSAALSRTSRGRVLVATGLLLLAAAGVYRVGIVRELQAVRAERAAMAPALDSLGLRARANDPLAVERAVHAAARTAVPWARIMATLGVTLPRDAHLLGVRAMGDTIELDGAARDAGAVFAALEQARFTELSAAAPVRRERSANGDVTERFTFRARVPQRRARTPSPRVAEGTP